MAALSWLLAFSSQLAIVLRRMRRPTTRCPRARDGHTTTTIRSTTRPFRTALRTCTMPRAAVGDRRLPLDLIHIYRIRLNLSLCRTRVTLRCPCSQPHHPHPRAAMGSHRPHRLYTRTMRLCRRADEDRRFTSCTTMQVAHQLRSTPMTAPKSPNYRRHTTMSGNKEGLVNCLAHYRVKALLLSL